MIYNINGDSKPTQDKHAFSQLGYFQKIDILPDFVRTQPNKRPERPPKGRTPTTKQY